ILDTPCAALLLLLVAGRLLGAPLHRDGRGQLEGYGRLSRDLQVFVAGERRASRTSACTDQTTNQSALAAAGDSANQSAGSRAATNGNRRTFALTLNGHCIVR